MKKESAQSAVATPNEKKASAKRLQGPAMRASHSPKIKFGSTSIAVKLYTAASSETVSFNNIHKDCGERVKQQTICPVHNEVLKNEDIAKGYEYEDGCYAQFTEKELRDLDTAHANEIVLEEFVPPETVDFIFIEKTYYLGPGDGAGRGYRLLVTTLNESKRIAVGRWGKSGKKQIVLVRPYKDGLVLQPLFYATQVRNFRDVYQAETFLGFEPGAREAAAGFVADLSTDRFRPEKYTDDYRERVIFAAAEKTAGRSLTPANLKPIQPDSRPSDADEGVG